MRPKAVDAKAAAAIPVFDARGELRAVVGIAWNDERDLDDATRSLPSPTRPRRCRSPAAALAGYHSAKTTV
jgi:hypothetical protein